MTEAAQLLLHATTAVQNVFDIYSSCQGWHGLNKTQRRSRALSAYCSIDLEQQAVIIAVLFHETTQEAYKYPVLHWWSFDATGKEPLHHRHWIISSARCATMQHMHVIAVSHIHVHPSICVPLWHWRPASKAYMIAGTIVHNYASKACVKTAYGHSSNIIRTHFNAGQ